MLVILLNFPLHEIRVDTADKTGGSLPQTCFLNLEAALLVIITSNCQEAQVVQLHYSSYEDLMPDDEVELRW